jgi:hypothetical protein
MSPLAAVAILGPKLGEFARTYPDVVLDITTDEGSPACSIMARILSRWWPIRLECIADYEPLVTVE